MEKLDTLLKQTFLRISLLALLSTSLISPLFVFLFYYKRDLIKEYEINKLILLSISISFPAWLINFVLVSIILEKYFKLSKLFVDEKPAKLAIVSSMVSLLPFYTPCAVNIFWKLEIHWAIKLAFIIEVFIIVFLLLSVTQNPRRVRGN